MRSSSANSSATDGVFGFGVRPAVDVHHFFVVPPAHSGISVVRVWERFHWTPPGAGQQTPVRESAGDELTLKRVCRDGQVLEGADRLRLEVSVHKWAMVAESVARRFNAVLRRRGLPVSRFFPDGTAVEASLGMEMMVLLWAVKDADPSLVENPMVGNWEGFRPVERRWLYTMVNERWGAPDDTRGWRAAVREWLCAFTPPPFRADAFDDDFPPDGTGGNLFVDDTDTIDGTGGPGAPVRPHRSATFGFRPDERSAFFVEIPTAKSRRSVRVFEGGSEAPACSVSRSVWKRLQDEVAADFNVRLREAGNPVGFFAVGTTALGRLWGKELMVLLWALEGLDECCIPAAIRNWKSLSPEERWWLYTMTKSNPSGWKRGLQWALCEKPERAPNAETLDF